MKSSNEQSLGEAIRSFVEAHQLDDKLLETEIYQRWEELAGKDINNRTKRITFRQGHLRVYLSSASLREELNLQRELLLEKVNQRLRNRPVESLSFS